MRRNLNTNHDWCSWGLAIELRTIVLLIYEQTTPNFRKTCWQVGTFMWPTLLPFVFLIRSIYNAILQKNWMTVYLFVWQSVFVLALV